MGKGKSQADLNHQANQKNSNNTDLSRNNPAYKAATDNRAKQLNPNNPNYKGGKNK